MPGRRSIGCIGSKITFLCGVVCFSTGLTGWVNSFRLSFSSVIVSIIVVVVGITVRVRGVGVTVFVSRVILVVFSLFSLSFQRATLIPVVSWFFTVVTRWFGSVGVSLCGLLTHIIYR